MYALNLNKNQQKKAMEVIYKDETLPTESDSLNCSQNNGPGSSKRLSRSERKN